MIRKVNLVLLLLALFLAACASPPATAPEATIVQVTPLPTDTAVPPTATSPPTLTPPPPTETPLPEPTATPEPPPPTLAEQMDAFMIEETEAGRFSGVALVARGDEVILNQGYGYADREAEIPNTPDTRFPLGTVTIPITAVAVLQLQERGKLSLDDSICDYLDDCPEAWSAVEVLHLLSQSSGIQRIGDTLTYDPATDRYSLPTVALAQAQDRRLLHEPGAFFTEPISQSDYLLLGLVIEKASGQSYETYMRENIFDPLGMSETGLARGNPGRAQGYSAGSSTRAVPLKDVSALFSGAGLTSTMNDMLRFGQGLLTGNLLSEDSMDAMFDSYAPAGGPFTTGLGWFMFPFDGFMSGSMPGIGVSGYKADIVVFPEDDLMWILLTNQTNVDTSRIGNFLNRMAFAEQ